jgi:hypothetical protein
MAQRHFAAQHSHDTSSLDNTEDEVLVFVLATVDAREDANTTASSTSWPPILTSTNAEDREEPYKYLAEI